MKILLAVIFAAVTLCAHAHALDPEHAGAWFDSDNSGWGISLHVLDGAAVFWLYGHAGHGNTWLMSDVSNTGEHVLYWPQSSSFPVGHDPEMIPAGTATLTPAGDTLVVEWDILTDCGLQMSPVPPWCWTGIDSQGSATLIRLTP